MPHLDATAATLGVRGLRLADMRDDWFERLLTAYEKILREHQFLAEILKFEPPLERGN
jgi:hypothetical protein